MDMAVERSSVDEANSLDLDLNAARKEEESLTRIQKVMENPMILNKILYHTEDLGTARLVCSKWTPVATKILKERNWIAREFIYFDSDERNKKFLRSQGQIRQSLLQLKKVYSSLNYLQATHSSGFAV